MDWPPLTIMLLTYDRLEYAKRTIRAVMRYLRYDGPIAAHIADDGSPGGYIDELRAEFIAHQSESGLRAAPNGLTWSATDRGGYGANYNLATQSVHARGGVVLPLEDDWEMVQPLDMSPYVATLAPWCDGSPVECVRMGYLGWTQPLNARLHRQSATSTPHRVAYLLFDPASAEPHVWAGHPRLESVQWQRRAGPWPEGHDIDPGTTEFIVAQRPESRVGVAWPLDQIKSWGDVFAHIGTNQARHDQRPAEPETANAIP